MISHRYSTALSHLILAGVGIYCITCVGYKKLDFPQAAFGLIILNSIIGLFKWGNPEYGHNAIFLYRLTTMLQSCFVLPCITTAVLKNQGYRWELAYTLLAVSIVPLTEYLMNNVPHRILDCIIFINMLVLCVSSFLAEQFYGVAATFSYAFNHFCIKQEGTFMEEMPALDLFNYGLCFYTYFAFKAVTENKF